MRHLVAISGGKDSTAMALLLAERELRDYQFAITPTKRELPGMEHHWRKLECLLGKPLFKIPAPDLTDLIIKQKALPNWRMRWCTRMVKIEPFIAYAEASKPCVVYVGIRADEANDREGTDWNGVEGVTQDFPLVRFGFTLAKVKIYLRDKGVAIPERTDCDFCFFQRLAEWWRLWKDHNDRFLEAEALEDFTGHTFRSAQRDSWPASLKELRRQFESGLIPKGAAQTSLPMDISQRETMCAWCAR
jgi:hypothetical protein